MCGIVGQINFKSFGNSPHFFQMMHALNHRGPDDSGFIACNSIDENHKVYIGDTLEDYRAIKSAIGEANLYIGHQRLAIIDLSSAGHQPMSFNERYWISFNGEIYNYIELRQELKGLGYEFISQTDTEVILAAYAEWGEKCVERLNGDWAFCIFDSKELQLFFSRDRFGVKPFFFSFNKDSFYFASEIKALLSIEQIEEMSLVDEESVFEFLYLGLLDHDDKTFYKGIKQLRPGHNMSLDLRTSTCRTFQFYQTEYNIERENYSHKKAMLHADHIRELLIDSVRLRLRSDVPVGACLSGGLDSSSIVAIARMLSGGRSDNEGLHCFTASFPGTNIDETRYAEIVVKECSVIHHIVKPDQQGCDAFLDKLVKVQDEPFGGASVYSQYLVLQEAAKYVRVVLDGQGSDEIFAGYRCYRVASFAESISKLSLIALIREFIYSLVNSKNELKSLQQVPFYMLNSGTKEKVYRFIKARNGQKAVLDPNFSKTNVARYLDRLYARNLSEALDYYLTCSSLPHLLRFEDRNSMAHSIEARVPFTDYRLVDYVNNIPSCYKIHNGWTKWLLRLAMKDILSDEIVWRKDKLGFATPKWCSAKDVYNLWQQSAAKNHLRNKHEIISSV